MGGFSENSHRDWWPAQLLHTSRAIASPVWKVRSAGVLGALAWTLQRMMRAWEQTDLGEFRFLFPCLVPEGWGRSSCGWGAPSSSLGQPLAHCVAVSTFMGCVLYSTLAGERAEVDQPQSTDLNPERCTLPAKLLPVVWISRTKATEHQE